MPVLDDLLGNPGGNALRLDHVRGVFLGHGQRQRCVRPARQAAGETVPTAGAVTRVLSRVLPPVYECLHLVSHQLAGDRAGITVDPVEVAPHKVLHHGPPRRAAARTARPASERHQDGTGSVSPGPLGHRSTRSNAPITAQSKSWCRKSPSTEK
eukprot:181002-Rhodomonas_salina.1